MQRDLELEIQHSRCRKTQFTFSHRKLTPRQHYTRNRTIEGAIEERSIIIVDCKNVAGIFNHSTHNEVPTGLSRQLEWLKWQDGRPFKRDKFLTLKVPNVSG